MGKELFKTVAAIARLRKQELKKADKVPRTFDQKPFLLDGRLDLDITFGGKTMRTPIYLKMDSREQLLLSEGVCKQLGIISYHPDVTLRKNRNPSQKQSPAKSDQKSRGSYNLCAACAISSPSTLSEHFCPSQS